MFKLNAIARSVGLKRPLERSFVKFVYFQQSGDPLGRVLGG